MANVIGRCAVTCAFIGMATGAAARDNLPWDGRYAGFNLGDASSSSTGAPVGGVQIGEDFQYRRFVWGVGADLDFWAAKTRHTPLSYSGTQPSQGTYAVSTKDGPRGFVLLGSRVGYAGDNWMPYVRAGGLLATSSRSDFSFTPAGAKAPSASYAGGKDFSTAGWAAGGGFELGLKGAWSISAEYLHASLGRGSDSDDCSGAARVCAPFAGVVLTTERERLTANLFRVGISYWFNYW